MKQEKYIIGNIIHGDYDETYDTLEEALEAYLSYVEEGFASECEKEDDDSSKMTLEKCREFFYVKKFTEEIIVGGN